MSIYVSISCLYKDKELLNTIRTAKDNAFNGEDIHMGILFIGDLAYKNKIDEEINRLEYKNIKTKFVEFEDAIGIYSGRKMAAEMYDGQDYFLQIDAHTFFLQNWDVDLTRRYKQALKITKNKKTVITGIPGAYGYSDHMPTSVANNATTHLVKRIKDIWYWQDTGYSYFLKDEWWISEEKCIPRFYDAQVMNIDKRTFKRVKRKGFAPAIKICAAFIFGDKNLAEDTGIDPITFFWEEEILQSVNLIGNGFSLVHIGFLGPILHHYSQDSTTKTERLSLITHIFTEETAEMIMKKNYLDYYNDPKNKTKIKAYEEYAGIDLLVGRTGEIKSAKKYANKNMLFVR